MSEPNYELDLKMAVEVMGWKQVKTCGEDNGQRACIRKDGQIIASLDGIDWRLWSPTFDANDALQVMERLRNIQWAKEFPDSNPYFMVRHGAMSGYLAGWISDTTGFTAQIGNDALSCHVPTLPLAICLAAELALKMGGKIVDPT